MKRRRQNARGFTLIELLIALAISMVGLLGLLALQMITIRTNNNSRAFSEALGLAQEKIESLEILPFASLNALASPATENNLASSPGGTVTVYTRVTTITPNVVLSGATMTRVEVDVSWVDTSVAGKTHTVSLVDGRNQ